MAIKRLCGLRRPDVVPLFWQRLALFDMSYQVNTKQKECATADFAKGVFDTIMRDVGLLERTSTVPRQVVEPHVAPTLPLVVPGGLAADPARPKRGMLSMREAISMIGPEQEPIIAAG